MKLLGAARISPLEWHNLLTSAVELFSSGCKVVAVPAVFRGTWGEERNLCLARRELLALLPCFAFISLCHWLEAVTHRLIIRGVCVPVSTGQAWGGVLASVCVCDRLKSGRVRPRDATWTTRWWQRTREERGSAVPRVGKWYSRPSLAQHIA